MIIRASIAAAMLAVGVGASFFAGGGVAIASFGDPVSPSTQPAVIPALDANKPAEFPGLHNVVTYNPKLVCGGVPYGEEGFKTLSEMGIKTVISVDGALPDLELAKKYGMRYVHLPIGYNGFDDDRSLELARAIQDLPKPVYLHCHHGKHRSAGASGAALVRLGWMTPEEGLAKLKVSGTAANYVGLYEVVREARPATAEELAAASDAFPEQWTPSGMVESMVEIDEVTDRLKLIEKAGWVAPKDHPDLVPVAEAGKLADHFRLLLEDADVKTLPADFHQRLTVDSERMTLIEDGLTKQATPVELSATFKTVIQSCKDCHTAYRDEATPVHRELPGK